MSKSKSKARHKQFKQSHPKPPKTYPVYVTIYIDNQLVVSYNDSTIAYQNLFTIRPLERISAKYVSAYAKHNLKSEAQSMFIHAVDKLKTGNSPYKYILLTLFNNAYILLSSYPSHKGFLPHPLLSQHKYSKFANIGDYIDRVSGIIKKFNKQIEWVRITKHRSCKAIHDKLLSFNNELLLMDMLTEITCIWQLTSKTKVTTIMESYKELVSKAKQTFQNKIIKFYDVFGNNSKTYPMVANLINLSHQYNLTIG